MAANFADDIFKCIFLNEKGIILIQISSKFVSMSSVDNKPALVQIMVLATNRRQAITWTNYDPVQWRMYAALGGDELKNLWLFNFSSVPLNVISC